MIRNIIEGRQLIRGNDDMNVHVARPTYNDLEEIVTRRLISGC